MRRDRGKNQTKHYCTMAISNQLDEDIDFSDIEEKFVLLWLSKMMVI